jgi:Transcriptional regulator containing an amidase domain and an AraC-type DNA-binding HTH domain
MSDLLTSLQSRVQNRVNLARPYAPELQVLGSLETRLPSDNYSWDGMKRGGDPQHPTVLFQYTLDGWGSYETQGIVYRLKPGTAFITLIPSEHHYYLPAASSSWTFFWLMIQHPYLVSRIAQRQKECGPVFSADEYSPLLQRALDLFTFACQPSMQDAIAREQALFAFFWEYERLMRSKNRSIDAAERLLDSVRNYVLSSLQRPVSVEEIARHKGMSRSHFSHYFKQTTGFTPIQFIQRIRLEEATRLLLQTNDSIATIAQATGFANANHFCKVFRQRFHLSPGLFRRQMR